MTQDIGGFLIPETSYIDEPRRGILFSAVRWLGQQVINFGAWLRSLGYSQREIHPYKVLLELMQASKLQR